MSALQPPDEGALPSYAEASDAALILDATSDASEALISSLVAGGHFPITALPRHSPSTEWTQRMAALGVTVELFWDWNDDARRRLLAVHPLVFLYHELRFERSDMNMGSEMLAWLRACHEVKTRHVVYVSTSSPEVFQSATQSMEGCTTMWSTTSGRCSSGVAASSTSLSYGPSSS